MALTATLSYFLTPPFNYVNIQLHIAVVVFCCVSFKLIVKFSLS